MPDTAGNVKGIATTGKVGERIEAIFGSRSECSIHASGWCDGCVCRHASISCPEVDECSIDD